MKVIRTCRILDGEQNGYTFGRKRYMTSTTLLGNIYVHRIAVPTGLANILLGEDRALDIILLCFLCLLFLLFLLILVGVLAGVGT